MTLREYVKAMKKKKEIKKFFNNLPKPTLNLLILGEDYIYFIFCFGMKK